MVNGDHNPLTTAFYAAFWIFTNHYQPTTASWPVNCKATLYSLSESRRWQIVWSCRSLIITLLSFTEALAQARLYKGVD